MKVEDGTGRKYKVAKEPPPLEVILKEDWYELKKYVKEGYESTLSQDDLDILQKMEEIEKSWTEEGV